MKSKLKTGILITLLSLLIIGGFSAIAKGLNDWVSSSSEASTTSSEEIVDDKPNPNVEAVISGNITSNEKLVALSDFTLPETTFKGIIDVYNNFQNKDIMEILQDLSVDYKTDGLKTSSGNGIIISEYDKLSANRSIICIQEDDNYLLSVTGKITAEISSPQLKNIELDEESDSPEVIMFLIDTKTGKVYFEEAINIDPAVGKAQFELSTLGIAFLIYRFYKPVYINCDEQVTYKFIEHPDLNSDDAYYADGYAGLDKKSYYNGFEFISNDQTFYNIKIDSASGFITYENNEDAINVYDAENDIWTDEAYRTVQMVCGDYAFNYFAYKWLFTNANWKEVATLIYTLPTLDLKADGYTVAQGDIEVTEEVYNAITELNNGGSLIDFGKTCGLTIPSNMKPFYKMGARLIKNVSTYAAPEVNSLRIEMTIENLNEDNQNNVHLILFNYENNTATYSRIWEEFVDVESHIITIYANEINENELVLLCYEEQEATTETWLLNENITCTSKSYNKTFTINFKSNNKQFTSMSIEGNSMPGANLGFEVGCMKYNDTIVYQYPYEFSDTTYRTIIFETAPTGELLTWLQANGVKQTSSSGSHSGGGGGNN